AAIGRLKDELAPGLSYNGLYLDPSKIPLSLTDFASGDRAQIRIFDNSDGTLLATQDDIASPSMKLVPEQGLFRDPPAQGSGYFVESGYRVAVRQLTIRPDGTATLLYALPLSNVDHTLARVEAFLLLGVLGGTVLAMLAGLFVSQRAMRPIVELTDAAREIERTRDPARAMPSPEAEDEIAELARTLSGMLAALEAARSDTQTMLDRQREFVADASHELRTPLTSVLANLDLLTEELAGEQAETAEAALRSTRRMRRLVGDLLLLARAPRRPAPPPPPPPARPAPPPAPPARGVALVEAAAELGPRAERHGLSIDAQPATVDGVRDELHRLVLNLLENTVRHTPPGTRVEASTEARDGVAVLIVQDFGPGIPPELSARVFERFVRGGRDGAKGSGLGLAIVRSVAQSHGGTGEVQTPAGGRGTRFVIRIPTPHVPRE